MIGIETVDIRLLLVTLAALFFFGVAYNAMIEKMGGKKDGYTALLVVAGVIGTLAGVAVISWQAAVLTGVAFVFSGAPMIIGDVHRAIRAREAALNALRDGRNE